VPQPKIYLLPGDTVAPTVNSLLEFDPIAGTWNEYPHPENLRNVAGDWLDSHTIIACGGAVGVSDIRQKCWLVRSQQIAC